MKNVYANINSVIDADAHVNPPAAMWGDYLPSSLRNLAPKIESGEDFDYIVFEGQRKKLNLVAAQAGRKSQNFNMFGREADARSGGWMPQARLKDMDEDGIDAAMLFGGGPLGTSNPELYRASFDAYNRWLADFCHYSPKRLAGAGYISLEDIDDAVLQVKDLARRGLKAVNIPAHPMGKIGSLNSNFSQALALTGDPSGELRYDDPLFDPFWAACCDAGLPVTIHLGGRPVRFDSPKDFLPDLVMSKFAMAEPIAIMIFGGVFDRFPDLKFVSVESNVGWFAFTAQYMDDIWHKQRHFHGGALSHDPSYYWDKNIFGSFIRDRLGILIRDLPGGNNIMWSSDYPHSESSYPHSRQTINALFEGVPTGDVVTICRTRAKQLYAL